MSILRKLPPIPVPRIARFLAVIAIAMATGHLVQTLAARKPMAKVVAMTSAPQGIVQLSAASAQEGPLTVMPKVAVTVVSTETERAEVPMPEVVAAPECQIDLALDAGLAAMIGIVVIAPCHANERVVLRHAGLAVTARLDSAGNLTTALPALVSAARVEVMFGDGDTVDGALDLPEAAFVKRFGVQWQGPEAFLVHGFENGADFGQPGHISPVNPRRAKGGQLAILGDSTVEVPLLAQIYTYPTAPGQSVEVVIEAAVTEATCGHELLGETIESGKDRVLITELTLAMPDCSGVGDFLVLKNLGSDLKIAAN